MFVKPFLAPQYYRRIVNPDFRNKVEAVLSHKSSNEEIIRKKILPDEARELLSWGDRLVAVEQIFETENGIYKSRDVITVSRDDGATWQTFLKGDALCDFAATYKEKLICIVAIRPLQVNVFGDNGLLEHKKLVRSADVIEVFRDERSMYIVWRDERARWINSHIFQFPIYSGDYSSGPWLIWAGKLNLDTLDFEEHVIGYDVYDLEELFGGKSM